MTVGVRINVTAKVSAVKMAATGNAVGQALADYAKKGMARYIPVDTGRMRDTAEASPWKVTYAPSRKGKHYAVYPYSGKHGRIHTEKNPHATAHWPQVYFSNHKREFNAYAEKLVKKGVKR